MNVKIDSDILETILKAHSRRQKHQLRIYGALLGTLEGKDSFHVKNCLISYIYEEVSTSGSIKFARLNDAVIDTLLTNYMNNFPDHIILGGFSTDSQLFNDLYILFDTINDIQKYMVNKNKLLLLVDPVNYDNTQVMNWRYEQDLRVLSFKKVSHEIVNLNVNGSVLHSNFINKSEFMLNVDGVSIDDNMNFNSLIEAISRNIDEKLKFNKSHPQLNNLNLNYLKKQLLMTEKFLFIIEKYLDNSVNNLNKDILHKVDHVLSELTNSFNSDEILSVISNEFKQTQIINSLSNLLNLQIKITEKLNKYNI